jgi:WD40 repeat protein
MDSRPRTAPPFNEKIVLWNLATGNLVAIEQAGTLDGDKDNGRDAAIAFTSDGKTLAAIGEKSLIKVWDVETKKEKGKFQALGFHSQICFSPDGKTLYGNETRNWDVGSGKELNPLLIKQRRSVYSPNCECVATSEGFSPVKITILELSSGKKSAELPKQDGIAVAVSFPTKRFLSQHEETKKLSVWDFAGKKIADLDGLLNDQCNQIAVSHDGKYLVACIEDPKSRGLFKVWDFATGKELTTLQQNPSWGNLDYHSVAFSKDDKMLAAGSEQGKIAVWTTEVVAGKK